MSPLLGLAWQAEKGKTCEPDGGTDGPLSAIPAVNYI